VPSSDPVQRFADIIENIARIERFTQGMDMKAFAGNVKYALLIVSEAAAKLGDTAVEFCPEIPWREVRGLGNRLRHDYDSIDIVRIWLLLERDLPTLKAACQSALRTLGQAGESF